MRLIGIARVDGCFLMIEDENGQDDVGKEINITYVQICSVGDSDLPQPIFTFGLKASNAVQYSCHLLLMVSSIAVNLRAL